mgnify:CR=1 FL=1
MLDQKGSGTYAENVEFIVDDQAALTVVNVHDWADDTVTYDARDLIRNGTLGATQYELAANAPLRRVA